MEQTLNIDPIAIEQAPPVLDLSARKSAGKTKRKQWSRWGLWLAVIGPGLMVMLADTDAGSIITAAQSGAQWGYTMILPQLLLIPILYFVQEMTVRLGLVTGKGHGELIREHFGMGWAMLSVVTLFVACVGALVTEFAGIAGVANMFHIPLMVSVPTVTVLLVLVGLSGSYRRVEKIGLAVGLLELLFVVAAILSKPNFSEMAHSMASFPIGKGNYLFLLAANVGAVIMPWMVFYQQGAVIDKRLQRNDLRLQRWDTKIGAVVTQVIMIAVVIAAAVGIHSVNPNAVLNDFEDVSRALIPSLGKTNAVILFGLGMAGAAFLAAIVVSLAGAWGLTEAFRMKHSLDLPFKKAKGFYSIYTLAHVGGAAIVLLGLPLISLMVDVEVMNAALLPIVLTFLIVLERKALPKEYRMTGARKHVAWALTGLTILFGVYTAVMTMTGAMG
ncbi:MAG TPA: divalent metal cation transporter [Candidatus Kapabacteria bacterium]|jgi:NRAMP (natural resistance-associated macrophage protein)-like metal ion transporter